MNKARHALFVAGRAIESIPPTEAALGQHIKRATLQCSIWRQSLQRDPTRQSPDEWDGRRTRKATGLLFGLFYPWCQQYCNSLFAADARNDVQEIAHVASMTSNALRFVPAGQPVVAAYDASAANLSAHKSLVYLITLCKFDTYW